MKKEHDGHTHVVEHADPPQPDTASSSVPAISDRPEKLTHTPLPWTTMGVSNPMTDPRMSLWGPRPAGAESGEWIAKDLTPANVAFVLRCVNTHDALVLALRVMLHRYVSLVNCGDCGHWDPETEPEVIAARAALAKAEGGLS